jgi:hypothetical protein
VLAGLLLDALMLVSFAGVTAGGLSAEGAAGTIGSAGVFSLITEADLVSSVFVISLLVKVFAVETTVLFLLMFFSFIVEAELTDKIDNAAITHINFLDNLKSIPPNISIYNIKIVNYYATISLIS